MKSWTLFSLALFGAFDSEGWVFVERPKQESSFEMVQEDSSIEPIFAMRFGLEKFLIRFPEEPQYFYPASDELEIFSPSKEEGGMHRLHIFQNAEKALDRLDTFYQKENGEWLWESRIATPHHIYVLQTTHRQSLSEEHRAFVASLEVSPLFP